MPIIEVDHVTKEFTLGQLHSLTLGLRRVASRLSGSRLPKRPNFKALDDIDFKVDQGEVLGIVGHNGAGKSTLLKILSRITVPTKGCVTVRGRVAPLIEVGAGLVEDLTGRENIYLNGAILGMPKAEIRRKFDEIVSFSELEQFIDTPLKRYSSGMQVRLAFSVAISAISDILIVDEVLAVGDVAFQRKCLDRMEQIIVGGGRTVLVVGHNIRQLERMCSRMLLLDRGRILLDGDPGSVCKAFFDEAERKITAQTMGSREHITPSHDVGAVHVSDIDLLGSESAETGPEIPMHGAVQIRIRIHAKRHISRPEVVIGAHTPDMVYVFSMSSALGTSRPDIHEGFNEIDCAIPDVPLRPGHYSLRLAITDQLRNILWYGEHLSPFRVVPGATDMARLPEVGLTHLNCAWTFSGGHDTTSGVNPRSPADDLGRSEPTGRAPATPVQSREKPD